VRAKLARVSRDEGTYQDLAPLGARPVEDPRARAHVDAAAPPLVPRGAGEILDLGLEILRDRFAAITGTCVLLWIPARVIEPLLGASALMRNELAPDDVRGMLFGMGGVALTLCVQMVVQALATALVARLVFAALHGEPLTVRDALGSAARSLIGLLVIAFVTAVAAGVGLCLLVVPFVYLRWKLSIAPAVYVVERGGIGSALSRSFALTPGSFLRWLAIMVVLFVFTIPFSTPVAFQPQIRALVLEWWSLPPFACDLAIIAVSSVFLGLASALEAVITTIFYVDCRVRREGYGARRELEELRASHGRVDAGEAGQTAGAPA
jgi:hypothetical protein